MAASFTAKSGTSLVLSLFLINVVNIHGKWTDVLRSGIFGIANENGCKINISELPENMPLIFRQGYTPVLVLPDSTGMIDLSNGDTLRLVCSGGMTYVNKAGTSDVIVRCQSDTSFAVPTVSGEVEAEFNELYCTNPLGSKARYKKEDDPLCKPPKRAIEIGFFLPYDGFFLRLLDVCFIEETLTTAYTKFEMKSVINNFQRDISTPKKFIVGDFYGQMDIDSLYSKQWDTVYNILGGSKELADKYVNNDTTSQYRLSRGHLAAKTDFIYAPQQLGTYYYVNTAPQWQTLNGNNWKTLEMDLKKFAASSNFNLTVFTGTHGVATLEDSNGKDQPLALLLDKNNNKQIEVPALFWKVAYETQSSKAVAFVSVNNPYLDPVPKSLILCKDICDKIKWVSWSREDITKGYSYCCDVKELREKIENIPKFEVEGVLGASRSDWLHKSNTGVIMLTAVSLFFSVFCS